VEPILADHRPSARMKRVSTTQISSEDQQRTKVKQSIAHASKLAEVVIVRDRDLGKNDTQFTVVTHLGPLLSPGDYVLGYDLTSTNFNIDEDGKKTLARIPDLPDVILVRKVKGKFQICLSVSLTFLSIDLFLICSIVLRQERTHLGIKEIRG
jgi:hypothetical protein